MENDNRAPLQAIMDSIAYGTTRRVTQRLAQEGKLSTPDQIDGYKWRVLYGASAISPSNPDGSSNQENLRRTRQLVERGIEDGLTSAAQTVHVPAQPNSE